MQIQMSMATRAAAKIGREAKKAYRLQKWRHTGLRYMPPNFIYFPTFTDQSIVIDAGCGQDADFSIAMINSDRVKAYAIDPTRKHKAALSRLVSAHGDRLIHLHYALGAREQTMTFHESKSNESGSLLCDHVNTKRDETTTYDVQVLTLPSLIKLIGAPAVDMLKLDLEGAEYALLEEVTKDQLFPFKQIFVEFHHHAVPTFTKEDTRRIAKKIASFGFDSYTLDDHNYLFRRQHRPLPLGGTT